MVVYREIIAWSGYNSARRSVSRTNQVEHAREFAKHVAAELVPPEVVYVLDICDVSGRTALLELNPFSGADLYGCQPEAVADSVSAAALGTWGEV